MHSLHHSTAQQQALSPTSSSSSSWQQRNILHLNQIILDPYEQHHLFKIQSEQTILNFRHLTQQLKSYMRMRKIFSITQLYLESNYIDGMDLSDEGTLDHPFHSLQYLNLNRNKMTQLDVSSLVRMFSQLEVLVVSQNRIVELKACPQQAIFGSIKVLDLSFNHLKRIDGLAPLRHSLQILNIQHNEMECFEDLKQILELEQLTNVDFRKNPIRSLDEENLIFENILDRCHNLWFINGATTLASPLVEDAIDDEFTTQPIEEDHQQVKETTSPKSQKMDPKQLAEEMLNSRSYIAEHLKTLKKVPSGVVMTQQQPVDLLVDPNIKRNLMDYAKKLNRTKRSDSCPPSVVVESGKKDGMNTSLVEYEEEAAKEPWSNKKDSDVLNEKKDGVLNTSLVECEDEETTEPWSNKKVDVTPDVNSPLVLDISSLDLTGIDEVLEYEPTPVKKTTTATIQKTQTVPATVTVSNLPTSQKTITTSDRTMSIKERAKQNMLKKLNL